MINYSKINIEYSINSGQVFLWKKIGAYWYGVNGQSILRLNSKSDRIKSSSNDNMDIFRNNDNLEKIIKSISKDKRVKIAVKNYPGLRILRQDPFQCIISFIVSSNSNIQNIKKNLENLCKKFGKKIIFDGYEFYTFPAPKVLASAKLKDIKACGTGYRSKFIKETSKIIANNEIDFDYLKRCNYQETKKIIKELPGIGNKVADCILLFSLEKLDAFPLDRWILRVLQENYSDKFEIKTKTITEKQYELLHKLIIDYFGEFAGYAQQFLFKMERDLEQKKWL